MNATTIHSIDPATEKLFRSFEVMQPEEVRGIIECVHARWLNWRRTDFAQRSESMRRAAGLLRERTGAYAELMTREMGKPITQSLAEIEKCAWVCEYFAAQAESILAPEPISTDAAESMVVFEPLGVVLAIMPWNFPFWQVFRFAAPALMAGNAGILKHASNVTGCALAIEEVFRDAGFPEDTFRTLVVGSSFVESIISDERIAAVTLTGSEEAGRSVASAAGKAIKKSVLELGGSDPFIVLEDADIEAAAQTAATARCINAGQSCIAAKRFIVVRSRAEEFESRCVEAMTAKRVGDPLDPATEVGPLARADLLDELHAQVHATIDAGGVLLCGGKRIDRKGFFYEPTVLSRVLPGMAAFDEETFGPVAAVVHARDDGDAIELANRSNFGLGASLWTRDLERGKAHARRIEAGNVFLNGMVKSDPRLPFGGIKRSGYGRELAHYGIKEFVNVKSIWIGGAEGKPK